MTSNTAQTEGPSASRQAASLEFREATKTYPGAERPAVDRLSLEVEAGEICVLVGPSGCGKTTAMRMVNRMTEIIERRHPGRRRQRPRARRDGAAARHRLRDPAGRPVPAPHDRREHRDAAEAARLGQAAHERPRRGAARPDRPAARDGAALPGAALRRPAPARRRRPRARGRPAADADGRAVRRDRPDQPRAAAERVPAPPGRDPQDDRLRHARHRRGDQDGRPHRDPPGGRHPRPVRQPGGAADVPREPVRGGLRGLRPRAQAAGAAARARRRPLEGAARARRRAGRRGAGEDRGRRHHHPAADRRREPAGRLAVRARPLRRARARGAALRARADGGARRRAARRAAATCWPTRRCTAWSSTRTVTWPACCRSRCSPTRSRPRRRRKCRRRRTSYDADPRPARAPRPQRRRGGLRGGQRGLPGLDRRQLRPLHRPAGAAHLPDASSRS